MREISEKATKVWILALTSVASFMVALDALVVTTALSTIRLDLDVSIEALEWIVNAYNLSFAVLLLTGAALGDRFGRRRMFAAGLGLFVAASAACALAGSAGWLIAARAIQGAGAALVMPLAMALLSTAFLRVERGKALGIFSGVNRPSSHRRPSIGRRGRRGPRVEVDILDQYPDRRPRHSTCAQSNSGRLRTGRYSRRPRPRARDRRCPRSCVGAHAREQRRLGQL
jgi:hypothetical protein